MYCLLSAMGIDVCDPKIDKLIDKLVDADARRRKQVKQTFEFEFTDHSGHESDRGGEILSYEFIVSGKKLLARVTDTTGDDNVPKQFGSRKEALKVLEARLLALKSEVKDLEEFKKHAASTTRLSLLDDNFEG
jgi:hypothetical protein